MVVFAEETCKPAVIQGVILTRYDFRLLSSSGGVWISSY